MKIPSGRLERDEGFIKRAEFMRTVRRLEKDLTSRGVEIMEEVDKLRDELRREVGETRASMDRAKVAIVNQRDAIARLIEELKNCGVTDREAIREAIVSLEAGQRDLEEALTPTGGSMGGDEE